MVILLLDKGSSFENLVEIVEKHGCDWDIFCMMLFNAYRGVTTLGTKTASFSSMGKEH